MHGGCSGRTGSRVASIVERSAVLSNEDAAALAHTRSERAGGLYEHVWSAWSPTAAGSPVGHGLILVEESVRRAAESVDTCSSLHSIRSTKSKLSSTPPG